MRDSTSKQVREFSPGSFSFIPGVFQYSAGVCASAGHSIRRVRFSRPVPLLEGFERIAGMLAAAGRPTTAFCACELRIREPFSDATFKVFNESYTSMLGNWGLLGEHGNPVSRSCVCPELDPPSVPSFFAFSYTVPADGPASFVISGSGEVAEGKGSYQDHIVRRGETSEDALAAKANWVVDEMERRMAAFGAAWQQATDVQAYTVHDLRPILARVLAPRGACQPGITWHLARPPVVNIEFEMDCRRTHFDELHQI
jgi:hypothetical protein